MPTSMYVSHIAQSKDPNDNEIVTACGEKWQGWQINSFDQELYAPPFHKPKPHVEVRKCQACLRVTQLELQIQRQAEKWVLGQQTPPKVGDTFPGPAGSVFKVHGIVEGSITLTVEQPLIDKVQITLVKKSIEDVDN